MSRYPKLKAVLTSPFFLFGSIIAGTLLAHATGYYFNVTGYNDPWIGLAGRAYTVSMWVQILLWGIPTAIILSGNGRPTNFNIPRSLYVVPIMIIVGAIALAFVIVIAPFAIPYDIYVLEPRRRFLRRVGALV